MKKIKMLMLGSLFLVGMANRLYAQSSPVTAGGDASGSGGTASYSVGEVVFNSNSTGSGLVIEGVQQAYSSSELPITLLQFKADVSDNKVALSWTTVAEYHNQYFTIEKSQDWIHFTSFLKVNSKGNSTISQNYEAFDPSPFSGTSYYRLKQTDVDGTSSYSNSVAVTIAAQENEKLTAYPNPTTSILNLQIKDAGLKNLSYNLFTIDGKLISKQIINNDLTVIPTAQLSKGSYLLQVISENSTIIKSFKIIKN